MKAALLSRTITLIATLFNFNKILLESKEPSGRESPEAFIEKGKL